MKQTFYNVHKISNMIMNSFQNEMKRRNFHDERLLLNWRFIFDDFASKIQPMKVVFSGIDKDGVVKKSLYVGTQDRQFATESIFYKKILLEKLNQYFGKEKSMFQDIKIINLN